MPPSIDQWKALLGARPLPAFRSTIRQVLALLEDENTNYPAMARVIQYDVGFCIRILQRTGRLGNKLGEPVTGISHAISLIGRDMLKDMASNQPQLEKLGASAQQGLLACYSRALHTIHYALYWARNDSDAKANALFAAGLLHEFAEMALWSRDEATITEIYRIMAQGSSRNDAAASVMGISLDELSGELRRHLRLPELCSQQPPGNPLDMRRLQIIKLTCILTHATTRSWDNDELLATLEQLAELFQTSIDKLNAELHRLAVGMARDIHRLGLPCPAFYLPLPAVFKPRAKPARATRTKTVKTQAPEAAGKKAMPKAPTPPTTAEPPLTKRTPTADSTLPPKATTKARPDTSAERVEGITPQPDTPPPRRSSPLQDSLSQTMKEMRDNLELPRVAFIMLSKDRKSLQMRLVMEQDQEPTLRGISTETGRGNLFGLLLRKPQAFWMNANNHSEYVHLVPKKLAEELGTQHFFVMPVLAKGIPIGLLYADGGREEKGLSRNSFARFKSLGQRINNALKQ